MKKELKDYLHLYLGCDCRLDNKETGKLIGFDSRLHDAELEMVCYTIWLDKENDWSVYNDDKNLGRIKPILRPLNNMTEEEIGNFFDLNVDAQVVMGNFNSPFFQVEYIDDYGERTYEHQYITQLKPEQYRYLISKHFDIFGLIESGLAIDKTTLK